MNDVRHSRFEADSASLEADVSVLALLSLAHVYFGLCSGSAAVGSLQEAVNLLLSASHPERDHSASNMDSVATGSLAHSYDLMDEPG